MGRHCRILLAVFVMSLSGHQSQSRTSSPIHSTPSSCRCKIFRCQINNDDGVTNRTIGGFVLELRGGGIADSRKTRSTTGVRRKTKHVPPTHQKRRSTSGLSEPLPRITRIPSVKPLQLNYKDWRINASMEYDGYPGPSARIIEPDPYEMQQWVDGGGYPLRAGDDPDAVDWEGEWGGYIPEYIPMLDHEIKDCFPDFYNQMWLPGTPPTPEETQKMMMESLNEDMWSAAQQGQMHKLLQAVARGADIHAEDEKEGRKTAMHFAADAGHTSVVAMLSQLGATTMVEDCMFQTPLHLASRSGHTQTLIKLIECGADVNTTSHGDFTPLHYAAMRGHCDIIKALIEKGSTVWATDWQFRTPLQIADFWNKTSAVVILAKAMRLDHDPTITNCGSWWVRHVVTYDEAISGRYWCWCSLCCSPSDRGQKPWLWLFERLGEKGYEMLDKNEEYLGGPLLQQCDEDDDDDDNSSPSQVENSRGETAAANAGNETNPKENTATAASTSSATAATSAGVGQQAASNAAQNLQQPASANNFQQTVYPTTGGYAFPHPGGGSFPMAMNVTKKESTVERISQQDEFDVMRDPRDFRHLTAHHPLYDAKWNAAARARPTSDRLAWWNATRRKRPGKPLDLSALPPPPPDGNCEGCDGRHGGEDALIESDTYDETTSLAEGESSFPDDFDAGSGGDERQSTDESGSDSSHGDCDEDGGLFAGVGSASGKAARAQPSLVGGNSGKHGGKGGRGSEDDDDNNGSGSEFDHPDPNQIFLRKYPTGTMEHLSYGGARIGMLEGLMRFSPEPDEQESSTPRRSPYASPGMYPQDAQQQQLQQQRSQQNYVPAAYQPASHAPFPPTPAAPPRAQYTQQQSPPPVSQNPSQPPGPPAGYPRGPSPQHQGQQYAPGASKTQGYAGMRWRPEATANPPADGGNHAQHADAASLPQDPQPR